jgi:uncharacterized membrane protein
MICLPVARVFFLAVTFYRERDLPYAAIAVLVLCIIALSLWLGARS